MVSFRTFLKVEAVPECNIQEMTARMNDFIYKETDTNRYISFFFCELDNLTGALKYVNAGHNPPIVIHKKGKMERLACSGLCLGMFPSEEYVMNSTALNRGDIAVLYTDGITECRNEDNKEFGENRLVNLVKKYSKFSAKTLLEKVFEELNRFSRGVDQMDDMTLVIIKRNGSKN